jgi:hypothetical protein
MASYRLAASKQRAALALDVMARDRVIQSGS